MAPVPKKIKINYTRPPLYDYQREILDCQQRYSVTIAATKVGKTASHIIWLFEEALKLRTNQKVWWVAPSIGQARIAYDRMKNQISNRNFFKSNDTERTITLITGGVMEFKTAEKPDNLFGEDVYGAVFDEFTRARETAWFALRSTITSTGGKVKFIGNAKSKKNWGQRLAASAKTEKDPEYKFFKITAYDAAAAGMLTKDGKPFIVEIEAAKRDLPEYVFNELYLAEPSEDGSNPFGLSHIAGCISPLSSLPPVCYGVDLGKSIDYTVIIGLDKNGAVCDFRIFQKDWKQTTEEIVGLPNCPIAVDSTGVGDPIAEDVIRSRDNVEKYVFTSRSKQQLMEGLAVGIQKRLISFPDGQIRDQLDSFEFHYTRMGVRYGAPDTTVNTLTGETERAHDDAVCSLALAWYKWQTASVMSDGPSVW